MPKLLAVTYIGIGLWLSVNHFLAPALVLLSFVFLAMVAYASVTLWLLALPSILVLGSLYPWTGDLVFAEYDIGLCALLGGRLLGNAVKHFELPISEKSAYSKSISPKSMRADSVLTNKFSVQNASQRWLLGRSKQQLDFASLGPLWWLAALVAFVAGVRGWLSLPPALPGDQLSVYTTGNNAIQQAKVLFYAVALVPLLVGIFTARSLVGQRKNSGKCKLEAQASESAEVSHSLAPRACTVQPRGAVQLDLRSLAWARMETGFLISAAAVAAVVLAERFVSVGVWDWDQELRSAGPCMTMHIGDQHIDAYWAIALPFIIQSRSRLSVTSRGAHPSDFNPKQGQPDANAIRLMENEATFFAVTWRWLKRGLRCLLLVVVAYAIFATMSRATIVTALVAAIVLVIAQATYFNRSFRTEDHVGTRPLSRKLVYGLGSLLGLAGLVSVALILWNSGEAVPKRFASTAEGIRARVSHWQTVLEMASRTQSRLWLGTGLGTYPLEYRKHVGRAEQPIGLVEREVSSVKEFEVTLGKSDPLLISIGKPAPPWVASAGCDHEVPSHNYFGDFVEGKGSPCRCSGLNSASPANVGAVSRGIVDFATANPEFTLGWLGLNVSPSESNNTSLSIAQSATRFVKQESNPRLAADLPATGLRLVAGEQIYAAQLVTPHAPLPWHVEMRLVKSSPDCRLQMTVCHQVLLQSCDCVVPSEQIAGEIDNDPLQQISFALKQLPNDVAGAKETWRRAWSPTALSLVASGNPGDAIEVYDVRVTDAVGKSVLQNSDFKSGSRNWFFVSDDHLVWRAKNCFLHLLVETGLLGLGVALTLCSWVLSKCLYTAVVRRSWPACVIFTSLVGFLSIGMFGTLIDTPWILLLVIMQLAMAHGLVVSELEVVS